MIHRKRRGIKAGIRNGGCVGGDGQDIAEVVGLAIGFHRGGGPLKGADRCLSILGGQMVGFGMDKHRYFIKGML